MKTSTNLVNEITTAFTDALASRIADKKVRDIATVQKKGAGKASAFIREVLEIGNMPIFNAYMTVAVRHENVRSSLMNAHDWKVANMSEDVRAKYNDTMSSVGCASMLQQLMNSAVWSERRAISNQSLTEGEVGEIDYAAAGGIDVPDTVDLHNDANQRLQRLASALLAMQSHLLSTSNLSIEPLVLFSVDDRIATATGTEWVRSASADTFEDAFVLMGETVDQLRTEEQAAMATQAASFDYAAA